MEMLNCRYCKDPDTGMLVHHNECPEFVERMYELKELLTEIEYSFVEIDRLVGELECELFKYDGKGFLKWLRANRWAIKVDIWFIENRFVTRFDTKEVKELKNEILEKLKEFIIQ